MKKNRSGGKCQCGTCGKGIDMAVKVNIKDLNAEDNTPQYKNCYAFFHCAHCLKTMPKGVSPRQYGKYAAAGCYVNINGQVVGVVTVWCERCGRLVWDSRHLKQR